MHIAAHLHLPTLERGPRSLGEQPSSDSYRNVPLRGISAPGVYPTHALLQRPVSSYLTFSPLPRRFGQGGNFLWHFPLPPKRHPDVIGRVVLCCPDFPPLFRGDNLRWQGGKDTSHASYGASTSSSGAAKAPVK